MNNKRNEKKKININVPVELLQAIDDEADRKQITRTAYMLNAIQSKLAVDTFLREQPDIQKKLNDLNDSLEEVAKYSDKDFAGVVGQERIDL